MDLLIIFLILRFSFSINYYSYFNQFSFFNSDRINSTASNLHAKLLQRTVYPLTLARLHFTTVRQAEWTLHERTPINWPIGSRLVIPKNNNYLTSNLRQRIKIHNTARTWNEATQSKKRMRINCNDNYTTATSDEPKLTTTTTIGESNCLRRQLAHTHLLSLLLTCWRKLAKSALSHTHTSSLTAVVQRMCSVDWTHWNAQKWRLLLWVNWYARQINQQTINENVI